MDKYIWPHLKITFYDFNQQTKISEKMPLMMWIYMSLWWAYTLGALASVGNEIPLYFVQNININA